MNAYHKRYVDVLVAFDPMIAEAALYCADGDPINTRIAVEAIRRTTAPGTERLCKMTALYSVAPAAFGIAKNTSRDFEFLFIHTH